MVYSIKNGQIQGTFTTIPSVLNVLYIELMFRIELCGMADWGLRRTGSLPDFTTTSPPAAQHWSTMQQTTASLSRITDIYNQEDPGIVLRELASYPGSEEEGLELLIHRSPIGTNDTADADDIAEDEHLLDYDSDCDTVDRVPAPESDAGGKDARGKEATNSNPVCETDSSSTAMDTDLPIPGTSGTIPSESGLDAVYFQCRSARISSFKYTLISVSRDESFGKKLSVQSPLFGSFEDHGNLGKNFMDLGICAETKLLTNLLAPASIPLN
jgi:hypothetical protein